MAVVDGKVVGADRVAVVGPDGWKGTIPLDGLADAERMGYRAEKPAEHDERVLEQQYGDRPVTAAVAGAARGLTFGGFDLVAGVIPGVSDALGQVRSRNSGASLVGEILGGVAPAVASGGAGLLGSAARATPAGIAAGVAGTAGRAVEGALAGRVGAGVARVAGTAAMGASEGGLAGAGEGVSQVALTDHPMTGEAVMKTLGLNALIGLGAGAAGGAGAELLGAATKQASRVVKGIEAKAGGIGDDLAERLAAPSKAQAASDVRAAAKVDAKAIGADIKAERASLDSLQGNRRAEARASLKETDAALKAEGRKAAGAAKVEAPALDKETADAVAGFRGEVEQLDKFARMQQGQAKRLTGVSTEAAEELAPLVRELEDAVAAARGHFPATVSDQVALGKNGQPLAKKAAKKFSLELDDAGVVGAFRTPGAREALQRQEEAALNLMRKMNPRTAVTDLGSLTKPAHASRHGDVFSDIDARLEQIAKPLQTEATASLKAARDDLAKKLESLSQPATSQRLETLTAKQAELETLAAPQMVDAARDAVEKAESVGVRFNKLDVLAAANELGVPIDDVPVVGGAMDMVLKAHLLSRMGGGKGIAGSTLQGLAAKLLKGGVRGIPGGGMLGDVVGGGMDAVKLRAARAVEESAARIGKGVDAFLAARVPHKVAPIAAQKAMAATQFGHGKPSKDDAPWRSRARELASYVADRPRAEAMLAERLAPLRVTQPALAASIFKTARARLDYLATVIPKRAYAPALGMRDRWQPSDQDLDKFASAIAAAEDPIGRLLEEMKSGRLTPATAEAARILAPEEFGHMRQTIMERIPELQEDTTYQQRLQMGMIFDAPTDPTLDPSFVAAMQRNYAEEPGTDQGTRAPTIAKSDVGSLKNTEQKTGAQALQGA